MSLSLSVASPESGISTVAVTVPVTMAIAPIASWTPPAPPVPSASADGKPKWAMTVAEAKMPAAPRSVANMKTPGGRVRVVICAIPARVVVPRALDNGGVVNIGVGVAGGVADDDFVVRGLIYPDECYVVEGTFWADGIDFSGDFCGDDPFPLCLG